MDGGIVRSQDRASNSSGDLLSGIRRFVVHFYDHDQPLRVAIVYRERDHLTGTDPGICRFDRRFDVARGVVFAVDDDEVFRATSDEEVAIT